MTVASLAAAQDTWVGGPFPGGTHWENGANWSLLSAPGQTEDAVVGAYGFGITINSVSAVSNLTATDVSLYNYSSFYVVGNFDMETVAGSDLITGFYTSGLGSVSNIGGIGSTVTMAGGAGIQGVTMLASAGGVLNIVGSTISMSGASYLTVQDSYSSIIINNTSTGAENMTFSSVAENFGGTLDMNAGTLSLESGSNVLQYSGTLDLNYAGLNSAASYTVFNDGIIQAYSGSVNIGGDLQNKGRLFLTDVGFQMNGNLYNSGSVVFGTDNGLGGTQYIAGDLSTAGSGSIVQIFNGAQTKVAGGFFLADSGYAQVEGSSNLQVVGNLTLSNGSTMNLEDEVVGSTDLGGGSVTAANVSVNDSEITISKESKITTGSYSSTGDSSNPMSYNLIVSKGGALEATTGDLTNAGTSTALIFTGGSVNVDQGNLYNRDYAAFLNEGTVQVSNGFVDNSYEFENINGGLLLVANGFTNRSNALLYNGYGGSLTVTQSGLTNQDSAEIYVAGGGGLALLKDNLVNRDFASINVHDSGSQITVVKGNYTNQDSATTTVSNYGDIQLNDGNFSNSSQVLIGASYDHSGNITVSGNYLQTGATSLTKVYGTLTAAEVSLGTITQSGGFLGGSGTVNATVDNYSGTVDPGDPQILHIVGDYTQGTNGKLIINIDGPGGAGVGYDQLDITGNVNLGGTLEFELGPGYTPTGVLDFLNIENNGNGSPSGSITGSFTTVEELLANGSLVTLQGGITYGRNGASFQAVPEPASFAVLGLGFLGLLRRRSKGR